jgi:serine/threonine protein phosphatase PrpC
MSSESDTGMSQPESGREITARFSREELVRGWSARQTRIPHCVPLIQFAAKTDLGRVRENNEDKFDFYETDDATLLATRGCLYAVADGMGGHAAGQIASELALKNLIFRYYDNPNDDVTSALTAAIHAANEAIYQIASAFHERTGMGTTLTAAVVVEDRVYIGHIGDSRAYLIRDNAIRQVTYDHSWVAEQVRLGTMTEEEAELSPFRNVITRAIGTQPCVEPEIFEERVQKGDIWVLCSDGLTGHLEADEIRLIASTQSPSEACRQLVELASARGGRDNITVIVFVIRDTLPPDSPLYQKMVKETPSSEWEDVQTREVSSAWSGPPAGSDRLGQATAQDSAPRPSAQTYQNSLNAWQMGEGGAAGSISSAVAVAAPPDSQAPSCSLLSSLSAESTATEPQAVSPSRWQSSALQSGRQEEIRPMPAFDAAPLPINRKKPSALVITAGVVTALLIVLAALSVFANAAGSERRRQQQISQWINEGNQFFQRGDLEQARFRFERALAGSPSEESGRIARNNLAITFNQMGVEAYQRSDIRAAKQYFQHALAINPQNRDARSNLQRLQSQRVKP